MRPVRAHEAGVIFGRVRDGPLDDAPARFVSGLAHPTKRVHLRDHRVIGVLQFLANYVIGTGDAADEVMRRNGFPSVGDFPYRGRGAMSCIHLSEDATQPFYMERDALHNVRDSGWTIDCGEMREEHEESDLFIEHLAHIAARRPFIVPYLTLPIGCAVSFEREGVFIFTPGKEESRLDPGKPYDFGPWSLID